MSAPAAAVVARPRPPRRRRRLLPRPPLPAAASSLGTALRRYPVLALLPVVVLAAAGITLGLRRPPTYTASTTINVGAPDINSQATPGYVQAEQTLASAYSREVTSQFVVQPGGQPAARLAVPRSPRV